MTDEKLRDFLEGEDSEQIAKILNEALVAAPGESARPEIPPEEEPVIYIELMEDEKTKPWDPQTPHHAHDDAVGNVGMDFFAATDAPWERIEHTEIYRAVVRTGVRLALPPGLNLRLASRSGLGFKESITAFPGTIDSSYRGEIKVLLFSFGRPNSASVKTGDKIAQGIIFYSVPYMFIPVETVDMMPTTRGNDGFGSTG